MGEQEFYNWLWYKASPDEKKLVDLIGQFKDDYFEDMEFKPGSIVDDFTKYTAVNVNGSGESFEDSAVPEELTYFDIANYQFSVQELDDCYGFYRSSDKTLCVEPESLETRPQTILHEMIHLYEDLYEELPRFYHDILLWALYKKLRDYIPDLDIMIKDYGQVLHEDDIMQSGGVHDLLFFLKSLDLDIRRGYTLGTTMGYEYEDRFKNFSYKKYE